MALINRVTRLFRADIHAVLDRIEEPDILLRQAVREMEAAVNNDSLQLKQITHERQRMQIRQQELSTSLNELEASLNTCLESNEDNLARQVIKRKLEAQQLHTLFKQKSEDLETRIVVLQKQRKEQQAQLESMQQKLEIFASDNSRGEQPRHDLRNIDIDEADIEVALLQEKKKRSLS